MLDTAQYKTAADTEEIVVEDIAKQTSLHELNLVVAQGYNAELASCQYLLQGSEEDEERTTISIVFPNVAENSPPTVMPNFMLISSVTNSMIEHNGTILKKFNTNCTSLGQPRGLDIKAKGSTSRSR